MPNIENYLTYEHWQFDYIRHIFTLTVAVFGAGFVYFLLSARNIAPKYRASSYLSAVVMVSATYEIFSLFVSWEGAFAQLGTQWLPLQDKAFSNGFRYANWCIDVPMLLTQLLIVVGVAGKPFWSKWTQFTLAGLLMIFTGYVGQYFEPQAAGVAEGAAWPFWFWGFVSTLFFIWIVQLAIRVTHNLEGDWPLRARKEMNRIGWLLLGSWTLYAVAYGLAVFDSANAVVWRQSLYTVADISSKLGYGILLTRVALMRSAYEGFGTALVVGGGRALDEDEMTRAHDAYGKREDDPIAIA